MKLELFFIFFSYFANNLKQNFSNLIFYFCIVFLTDGNDAFRKLSPRMEATHVMEVAQLLLSLIHSWGIDLHLDKVCETQLGLLRPMVNI